MRVPPIAEARQVQPNLSCLQASRLFANPFRSGTTGKSCLAVGNECSPVTNHTQDNVSGARIVNGALKAARYDEQAWNIVLPPPCDPQIGPFGMKESFPSF